MPGALKHPGVLATKVGYFGVKSTKVHRVQMGTKPAKVGRLQSLGVNRLLKYYLRAVEDVKSLFLHNGSV